ncbi:hypothetical protein DI09_185p10 [Mitosporidium daphniae]|uniref:Elongation factor 1-gamma n=1 Tax=Mitosporidium daphniae TaxID=1485682 RepID=A0A098VX85_9MICR|nr:uncharacterized protein DI09_185p10 [Mitosporidium daphniae]KGG52346.1 hypothetical protein DI09_185p10 [Mitosporidium daphniae]|eukprot:XP_013238782.1 uncharacterized protein DI09_185p10 [Mitosporidium daphniae]
MHRFSLARGELSGPVETDSGVHTLYSYSCCSSTNKIIITAKYAGIPVTSDASFVYGETNMTSTFKSKFPFGKVPAMDAPEGPIYQSTAICTYLAESSTEKERLLGSTPYEKALIAQYMSLADNEFMPPVRSWTLPLCGFMPYSEELVTKARSDSLSLLTTLDSILLSKTFLVGEQITLADICLSTNLYVAFLYVIGPELRKKLPNLTRWYLTCFAQPEFQCSDKALYTEDDLLCKEPLTTPKPCISTKSECSKANKSCSAAKCPEANKSCSTKACPKPAAVNHDEEDEEEAVKEKPVKNALDELPPSSFVLDAWKRFYSNNETTPTAIDYFWNNWDPKGYSMYRLTYKDNAELTKIFMSSNLIGGFFQRLEHMRKYAFGSMCVFGEENNSEISGMFIIRGGPELPEMFKEVPDFDSYVVEHVDSSDPAIRDEWNAYLAWEGNFKKPFANGKIFK